MRRTDIDYGTSSKSQMRHQLVQITLCSYARCWRLFCFGTALYQTFALFSPGLLSFVPAGCSALGEHGCGGTLNGRTCLSSVAHWGLWSLNRILPCRHQVGGTGMPLIPYRRYRRLSDAQLGPERYDGTTTREISFSRQALRICLFLRSPSIILCRSFVPLALRRSAEGSASNTSSSVIGLARPRPSAEAVCPFRRTPGQAEIL